MESIKIHNCGTQVLSRWHANNFWVKYEVSCQKIYGVWQLSQTKSLCVILNYCILKCCTRLLKLNSCCFEQFGWLTQ